MMGEGVAIIKNAIRNGKVQKFFAHFFEWVISGLIGAIIGLFFSASFIPAFTVSIVVSIIMFSIIIIVSNFMEKYDIIGIMKDEIAAGNYPTVIQIGYTLSRPLHLSGRYTMREAVGQQMLNACRKMDIGARVRINDDNVLVRYIEAKILIDDLGWNTFLLGQSDLAIENIEKGIEIAEGLSNMTLAVKGYRHILGICESTDLKEKRDYAEERAREIIKSKEYRALFTTEDSFNHAVAEFEYAYAKALIDFDTNRALESAINVQRVFSAEQTDDMDRYCKTFDLIGDIYARSEKPQKLKLSRQAYLDGITECERYGRSERLTRIAISYISLLIKIIRINPSTFEFNSWEQQIDQEEKEVYEKALNCAKRVENKHYAQKLERLHKDYKRERKRMKRERRRGY